MTHMRERISKMPYDNKSGPHAGSRLRIFWRFLSLGPMCPPWFTSLVPYLCADLPVHVHDVPFFQWALGQGPPSYNYHQKVSQAYENRRLREREAERTYYCISPLDSGRTGIRLSMADYHGCTSPWFLRGHPTGE